MTQATRPAFGLVAVLATAAFALGAPALARPDPKPDPGPIVLRDQGSFLVGGRVVTNPGTFDPIALTPDGQTIHGDHAYVQYQIPLNPRRLPLVMWHGGGQFSKTWESTPDGRDGFQNLFIRRGFATYILDQPGRGRAGRTTTGTTLAPVPGPGPTGEQGIFIRFRIGMWPEYFPGVQFPRDAASLEQWWRQQTPDTGGGTTAVTTDAVAALFSRIGPAILVTHSASGVLGWITATKNDDVKAIVSYEPVGFVFPAEALPAPIPTSGGNVTGTPIPLADFMKLTQRPIQVLYGDNIPAAPQAQGGLDLWRGRRELAQRFVNAVNAHGGDAQLVRLPDVGVYGNTHFPMSDLNNVEIADLLSTWLRNKGLDGR
jgi:hypothetical protein